MQGPYSDDQPPSYSDDQPPSYSEYNHQAPQYGEQMAPPQGSGEQPPPYQDYPQGPNSDAPRYEKPYSNTLPHGWEVRYDKTGRVYYLDHNTQSTTYECPVQGFTPPPQSPSAPQAQTIPRPQSQAQTIPQPQPQVVVISNNNNNNNNNNLSHDNSNGYFWLGAILGFLFTLIGLVFVLCVPAHYQRKYFTGWASGFCCSVIVYIILVGSSVGSS